MAGGTRPGAVAQALTGLSPEAAIVLAGVSQSIGALVVRAAFDDVPVRAYVALRVAFAALVMLALTSRRSVASVYTIRHRSRSDRSTAVVGHQLDMISSVVLGISLAIVELCSAEAVDHLDHGLGLGLGAGAAIALVGPLVLAAIGVRSFRAAIAVAAAAVGLCWISGLGLGDRTGLLFVALAAAGWVGFIVAGTRVARRRGALVGLTIATTVAGVVLVPFGLTSRGLVISPRLLVACLGVALLVTLVGRGVDLHVMRSVPPARFGVVVGLVPVTALFVAFVTLDENPSTLQIAGAALVIVAVATQPRRAVAARTGDHVAHGRTRS